MVLLVAEKSGRLAVGRAGERDKRAVEAALLGEFAPRRLERRLSRLELAAHREPGVEPAVADDEHAIAAPRVDRHGERPPHCCTGASLRLGAPRRSAAPPST